MNTQDDGRVRCPRCGAQFKPQTPGGVCPACAFGEALSAPSAEGGTSKLCLEDIPVPVGQGAVAKEGAGDQAETILVSGTLEEKLGSRIGRYKLLEQIGEGGCGVVYVAEQEEPVRRRVALKVIKLGMDTRQVIARFEAERQALALMDHPNIAKVLDGGATEAGRPFFVMELVKGVRITDYCDRNNLSTNERLGLFVQVCHAIQHAHQKGIIHRDIKPSNILVTVNDGVAVPKVIDFGIAKATGGQQLTDKTLFTAFEQFIGTPAYMSPEQAEMTSLDIDTRSDIYALGVLLYELLTGKTPFDAKELVAAGLDEMRRIIREQEPSRPSTKISTLGAEEQTTIAKRRQVEAPKLIHQVRGDLDWIVMKCLEKDRTRRYEGASGLALDIEHHLKNEPVSAAAPGAVYRARKFGRRHKTALMVAGVILGLLVTGVMVSSWLAVRARRAEREQRLARQEAEKARAAEAVERKKAQDGAQRLSEAFSQMEQKKLDEVLANEGPSRGLAYLAQALRRNPDNYRAAYRLLAMLSYNTVARLQSQRRFEGKILATCYNSQGPLLLTSPDQRSLWLWDYRQERPLAGPLSYDEPLVPTESWLGPVQFSPSGQQFLVSLAGGTMEVWRTTNATTPICRFKPEGRPAKLEFSPDESRLLTGTVAAREFAFQVWDIANGKPLTRVLKCERDSGPPTVRFSSDGKTAAIIYFSTPGTMVQRVLDIATGTLTPQELLTAAPRMIIGNWVYLQDDGRCQLYVGQSEGQVLIPLATLKERQGYLDVPRVAANGRSVSSDGTELLTTFIDGSAGLWDVGPHMFIPGLITRPPGTFRTQGELARDGRRLLTLDSGGTAGIWDAQSCRPLFSPLSDPGQVSLAFVSPAGESAVLAQTNGWMRLWSMVDGKPLTAAFRDGHLSRAHYETNRLTNLNFSRDGKRLAATWSSGTVQVWEAREGKLVSEIAAHRGPVHLSILTADGKRLATVGDDQGARVWDVLSGTALTPPLQHSRAITACEFSPDGLRLATASEDTTARVWELQPVRNPIPPFKHESKVVSVHFIAGGTNLVTVSSEGVVRVFDATGGATVKTIKTGNSLVAWFDDERTVLVMNNANQRDYEGGRVWDLVTGSPLSGGIFTPLGTYTYDYDAGISLSGDGRRLAAVFDGHLRVWDLPRLGGPVPDWLPRLAEILAGQKLNEESLFESVEPGEFLKLREVVLSAHRNDDYQRWGEWFFAPSDSAAISPWSPITRQAHVQACVDANTEASLVEALRLAPGTAKPLQAYLRLTSGGLQVYEDDGARNTETDTLRAQGAQAAADELLELEPDNPIGWQVKGLALSRLGRHQEALEALDHANSAAPDPAYWHIRAGVLEKLGRNDEAGRAFTRAIQAAQADSQPAHYLHRSRFFQRQGKLAEAAEDACVGRGIPKREPATPAHMLDLSVAYTVPLTSLPMLNPAQPGGCELPVGVHKLGGIDFDVRGAVFFPPSALNKPISIPVKARCPGLHFLQATYAYSGRYGESSGKYTVHYADQRTEEIKLAIGRNVRDWWCYEGTPVETSEAPLVWVGLAKSTGEGRSPFFPCLYVMSWTNPWPEAEIDSLDFEPTGAPSMVKPFLIALTKAGDGAFSAAKPERTVFQQTLAILDNALASQPEQLGLVLAKAGLLERHERGEEALDLVSKAIAAAEAKYGRATNQFSAAVRYRSAVLSRLNRPADSQVLSNEAGGLPAKDSRGPASVTNTPGLR